jgi:prephenate dehydrogenase
VVEAAEALLPEGVHFVGGHPIVIAPPDEQAEPDPALFDRRLFCLTPSAGAAVDAVRLAADLVAALGAEPFFLDAGEHDSFAAAADHLPALLAGTLMRHASASPGWQDLRKVAGGQFFAATIVGGADGRAAAAALLANREALLARLDAYQAELAAWRGLVEAGDEASLAAQFELGSAARRGWLAAYETGDWEATPDAPPMPTSSSVFKGLFRIGPQRATPDPRKGK